MTTPDLQPPSVTINKSTINRSATFQNLSTTMLISVQLLTWCITLALVDVASASSPLSTTLTLRVRKADGSMDRVVIPKDEIETTTLSSILSSYIPDDSCDGGDTKDKAPECQIGIGSGPSRQFQDVQNTNQSLSSLKLQNGSIINIVPKKRSSQSTKEGESGGEQEQTKSLFSRYTEFDPFPDIAKSSHSAAARRSRALSRLPSKRSMSYGEISKLRDHMHTIEPQAKGPIKRIYMCHLGAQRFKDNCTIMPTKKQLKAGKNKGIQFANRVAVLFGSVNTERVDQSKKKSRTSLSTPLYEMEMCKVVKVHAVWEPSGQNSVSGKPYDCSKLWGAEDKKDEYESALKVADSLGLQVVGWLYSYSDDRQNDSDESSSDEPSSSNGEDALPVFGRDVVLGSMGQIDNMERIGRDAGHQFITLALDAKTGATEAFQLSDVSVQMVAEGKLTIPDESKRHLESKEPVVVDTKETSTLDSVLCLVNTAMLSHEGNFSGGSTKSSIKKSGALTLKAKKTILSRIDGDSEKLVASLCDFNTLMALARSIGEDEMSELCNLVKKYARGQRKAATPSKQLKLVLKNALGG